MDGLRMDSDPHGAPLEPVTVPHKAPAWRRWLLRVLLLPAGVILAGLIFLVWLMVAPMPVAFLAPVLEKALNEAADGEISAKVGSLYLSWFPGESRVGFLAYDLRIVDPDNREIMRMPAVRVELALSAILNGKIAPRRVEVTGLSAEAVRQEDGSVTIGVKSEGAASPSDPRVVEALLADMLLPPDPADTSTYLAYVGVKNASLTLRDAETGSKLTAPSASLSLSRDGAGVSALVDAGLDINGEIWPVSARGLYKQGSEGIHLELSFPEIVLSRLAQSTRLLGFFDGIDVPGEGTLTAELTRRGELSALTAWVSLGKGSIVVSPAGPDGIAVDSAELAMAYDGPSQSVLIEQLTLRAEGLSGSFSGQANLTYTSSGSISGIWGGMTGDAVTVNLPGLFSQKLSLDRIGFRGGYDGSENSLDIENASLRAGDFEMSLKGRLAYAQDRPDASPALALEGQLSALKVRDLAAYWPKGMGAGARDWIDANLSTGLITKGVLKADLPVGAMDGEFLPDEMLRLDFSFEGLEANFLSGLTHITEAKGSATLYGDRFEADLESGKVGNLRLTGGAILIDDFHIDYGPGNFKAKAEGEVKDILALIDMQPLGYASRFGINPEDAAGTASLSLDLTLPLKKDLPVSEIAFDIAAKTNGLGLDLGDGLVLSKGALDFAIDGTRLEAKGPVTMKDIPLDLKWIERFDAGSKPSSNVTIAATLDDAQRASIGFPHMDNVTGPIGLKADLRGRGGEVETGKVTLDLTQTTLSFTPLSWSKSEGEAAAARFSFRLDAKGRLDRIDDLEISGRKLAVSGDLDFDAKGSLTAAEFPLVNLGVRNDFRAAVARRDDGFLITFAGKSADLSDAIARMLGDGELDGEGDLGSAAPATPAEEASAATPLTLDGSLDHLYLRGTAAMTGVRLRSRYESGELAELVLTGSLSRGGAASIAIRQKSGRREMAVETANAGELVEGLTGFESMKGGNLNLSASLDAGKTSTATASGKLRVDKFRIVDQPFLARLFAAGSLVGISDLLRGEGIAFDRLDVPFRRKDGRWSIEDAKASGPSIGLTAEGSLGANGGINIVGTLVPIYGINSILDGIPLIGDILTSREGEGILGMTYAVRGSSDDLRISVNPLSAIAPGIFRRIFEYSDSPSASTNDRNRSATP